MARSLSLLRRRAGLVDIGVRVRAGVSAYKFQSAANFDQAFTTFATVPMVGLRSLSAPEGSTDGNAGWTRFVFSPADYSLSDTAPLWLKIIPVDMSGVDGTAEAAHLVLPYSTQPNRAVVVSGVAPGAASIAGSLELQLPGQCQNLHAAVDGAAPMLLAVEPGGAEFRVMTEPGQHITLTTTLQSFSQVFVRGDTVDTEFGLIMALRDNPAV